MFLSQIQKIIKFPVFILTIWALLFGFVCVGMFHEPSMKMGMTTSNSTLMAITGEQSCCGTNMSQHIQSWKDTFLAVPQGVRDALMLLVLGLALALGYAWFSSKDRHLLFDPDIGGLQLYVRQNPDIELFNYLKLAFARGILNPKIY